MSLGERSAGRPPGSPTRVLHVSPTPALQGGGQPAPAAGTGAPPRRRGTRPLPCGPAGRRVQREGQCTGCCKDEGRTAHAPAALGTARLTAARPPSSCTKRMPLVCSASATSFRASGNWEKIRAAGGRAERGGAGVGRHSRCAGAGQRRLPARARAPRGHRTLLRGRGGLQVYEAAQQRLHLGTPLALGLDLRGWGGEEA